MKGKHAKNTANKQKLAKRMLALCFAVVFLCSCVLPVFATGSSLLTDALREAVEETAASTDTSTEAGGGTMMDSFQTMMSSYTTEYKTTYRFWLSEKDSYYLPDAAKTSASDLEGYDDFYSVAAIVNNTTLTAPEGFQNPTDPTGAGRKFEGWYYMDPYGVKQTFTFDGSPVLLDKSATVDVFAKWEKVESTVEDEMEKTEPTTEDELDKTESGKANESKEETLPPVEKTGAVGLTNNEGGTVRIAVKAENLPGKVNELVVTDLMNEDEDEEGAAFGKAFDESNYADWTVTNLMVNITPKDAEGNTVEPNEAVTVHFSGLESLMIQYSSEMNLKVLHMKRDGTLEALPLKNVQTKETQEGTVLSSFAVSTTSFSPFVLAASESASIEPAKLDLGEYPAGDKYTYNNYRQITVDESIVVSCDGNHGYGSYTWSSSNTRVIQIVPSNTNTVRIKAVGTGYATISHGHRWSDGYTFYVAPSRGTENASIFFLNTPNADEDSNSTSQWLPSGGNSAWQVNGTAMDGTINTTSAKWDAGDGNAQNKNIFLHDTDNESGQYVTEWPDGAKTKAWTLYNPDLHKTPPTEYKGKDWDLNNAVFTDVLGKMWSGYESYLGKQLGVTGLTLEEAKKKITQITLTPYKISKNNDGMHIDCTIGVTGISYEAKFWVKAPGKTVYEQAYGKTYADKNGSAITEPNSIELSEWKNKHHGAVTLDRDGRLPENITGDNGVNYTLKKWYKEDGNKAFFSHTPTADEKHDGIVNFYAEYVADDQGKLDQNPYITVEKQIIGLPSDKVDELLEHFKVNVGRFELTRGNYDFKKSTTVDDVTTLRWKIDNVPPDSYRVTEEDYDVNGYTLKEMVGNNETFNVKNATFTASVEVITPKDSHDFKVGEDGNNQYWVFVASLTSGRNVVISNRTLSAKERASIIKAVANEGKVIGGNSNPDNTDFYSITENQEITIKDGNKDYKITYSDNNKVVQGPGIHIEAENMWNMVAKVNYDVANAKSADIKLTNTYTLNTTNVTIQKKVTGAFADRTKAFTFTVSGLNADATLDGAKPIGDSFTFKLSNGGSKTIENLEVGKNIIITESETDSKDYDTTADGHDGKAKSFEYKVCLDAVSGEIYLKPVGTTAKSNAAIRPDTDKKLSITVTNNFDGNPDTGVLLDTLPYVLMLIAVGGGVVAFFLRRRHHDDEE